MFLAIAEGYLISKGIHIKPYFGYYDHFYITKEHPELIKLKLMNNYHIFIAQKENYLNIFHTYDFYPDNFPVEKIREIVSSWIPLAEHINSEKIYKDILLLFYEDERKKYEYQSYYNEIKKTPKVDNKIFVHPVDQAKTIALIYSNKDEEMKRNEEKWRNQTIPTIDLIIGEEAGSSELSKKLSNKNNINEKDYLEKLKKEEEMDIKINEIFYNFKILIDSNRRDEKKNVRALIKEKIQQLKIINDEYSKQNKDLEGLWQRIKPKVIENQCKELIDKLKKEEDKILVKDFYSLFFEDNDDDLDMNGLK
jgi:hypothetical protein